MLCNIILLCYWYICYCIIYIFWRAWYQNIFQQDDKCTTSESEQESNENFEMVEHNPNVNSWLAPVPITTTKFNAMVSNVDHQGFIYFHCTDDGMINIL